MYIVVSCYYAYPIFLEQYLVWETWVIKYIVIVYAYMGVKCSMWIYIAKLGKGITTALFELVIKEIRNRVVHYVPRYIASYNLQYADIRTYKAEKLDLCLP